MEKKLTLQDIVKSIADKSDFSEKEVENFCRVLFDTIEAGLLSDKFVKVKGLGTFKLVAVSERESIDVNTGERIQISGHTKISFSPDNYLKDLVNRPFSHFQTVILNDDTNPEELATVSGEDIVNSLSGGDEETTDGVCGNYEVDDKENPGIPYGNDGGLEADTKPVPHESYSQSAESTDEKPMADLDGKLGNVSEDIEFKKNMDENVSHTSASSGPFRYVINVSKAINRPNWWRIVSISLFLFILLVLTYFAGYYKVFCPPCQGGVSFEKQPARKACKSGMKTQKVEKASGIGLDEKKDSVGKAGKHDTVSFAGGMQKENNGSVVPDVNLTPHGKYIISGTMETYRIKPGDNLNAISKKIYGHKEFSTYIIRYNNIANPNNIVVGKTIKIPLLKESD